MLHSPSPMMMAGVKDYAAWLLHIEARRVAAGGNAIGWSALASGWGGPIMVLNSPPASVTGAMRGSPFHARGYDGINSNGTRIVQHSMPSEEVFNAVRLAGGSVFVRRVTVATGLSFLAVTRNGFTSSTGAAIDQAYSFEEFSYWNPLTGLPETMSPVTLSGPVPYSNPGW